MSHSIQHRCPNAALALGAGLGALTLLAGACVPAAPGGASASATAAPTVAAATRESAAPTVSAAAPTAGAGATTTSASTAASSRGVARPAGWSEESHGAVAEPNYAVVFPEDRVNQLTITIAPEHWAAMQANMTELLGARGTAQGAPGAPGQRPPGGPPLAGGPPTAGGGQPAGRPPGPGGDNPDMTPVNPMWVPATLTFNGRTWTDVGVRYKGNSTLASGWRSGALALPLKLDFDEFEDESPAIENQRFYGFKQLSLSNNSGDPSYLRETLAYDLLEAAGLVAARTAFYEIVLDYGQGPVSLGVHTAVEVIDDTVIERAFGDDEGNIYEADGAGVSLAVGTTADAIRASFQKENNARASDWSDVEALYVALHAPERTTDPAARRAKLEAAFDADSFLEWLAIAAVIQHWDTYGQMSHNFYLYGDPATGRLTWISWDHNLILGAQGPGPGPAGAAGPGGIAGPAGIAGRGGMAGRGSTSLDRADIASAWPLIRYLLDDPTYYARYVAFMDAFVDEIFVPEKLAATSQRLATLLAPYAAKAGQEAAFTAAVQDLTTRIAQRAAAVASFLATQKTGA